MAQWAVPVHPEVAGALILAIGGVALAAFGVLALRIARGPAIASGRLDAVEQRLTDECARQGRLIDEAHAAAVAARRLATRRITKKERAQDDDEGEGEGEQLPQLAPHPPAGRPRVVGPDGQDYIPGETLAELASRRAREGRRTG